MFTGLVEAKVPLVGRKVAGAGQQLTFDLGTLAEGVRMGDSIALSGCCLTVVSIDGTRCAFELGSETLSKTLFRDLALARFVNCERSLRVGDPMGGHFVTGHIDGLGMVSDRRDEGLWRFLTFRPPASIRNHLAAKGSVCVDGVSLTVVEADSEGFSVALIPHTLEVTTLGELQIGASVHLESDILAKYVSRQLADRQLPA